MPNVIFLVLRRMRTPLIALVSVYAFSVLGLVLIPGMDDTGQPWRMGFFHAFYFVSFMGSTTGFGEIPYPFTDAQRLWVLLTLYMTVIAWVYAIGTLIALIQTPAFRDVVARNRFVRAVRRIHEPFYLVCGYGDAARQLIRALANRGLRAATVDSDRSRIDALELEDLPLHVPGLCADAADSSALLDGGLKHRACAGLVVLTDDEQSNLKIAITSKLLNPRLPVICRAETQDAAANIASFGTEHVIDPFERFANQLAMALASPSLYLLHEWLTRPPGTPLPDPLFPPHGRWILCGFGRFGKAVTTRLLDSGNSVTVIEKDPSLAGAPPDAIAARGTEADTLLEAGIRDAVGIIAATNDDANNLSIVMTAMDLNPDLFVVARQNRSENDAIFRAAGVSLVTRNSQIIASRVLALITTPLTARFLELAQAQPKAWADELISRISGIVEDRVPHTWAIRVSGLEAAAITELGAGGAVQLDHLCRDPADRDEKLPAIALMLKHGARETLLPDPGESIVGSDEILFCGLETAAHRMDRLVANPHLLAYAMTGDQQPQSWAWRRLTRLRAA